MEAADTCAAVQHAVLKSERGECPPFWVSRLRIRAPFMPGFFPARASLPNACMRAMGLTTFVAAAIIADGFA